MTFRKIDRFIVDVDSPRAVRYFNQSLRVPWSHGARLLTRLPFLTRFLGRPTSAQDAQIVVTDYPDSRRRRTIKFIFPATVMKVRELPAKGRRSRSRRKHASASMRCCRDRRRG